MKLPIRKTIVVCALICAGVVGNAIAGVPHTFSIGGPARSAEVNENFSDLDGRLTSLETIQDSQSDFSGYGTPFAAPGQSRNVIVLASYDADGNLQSYNLRVFWSGTGIISVNGVDTVRQYFAHYPNVLIDGGGNITGIFDGIDSPDTADYITYLVEQSSYDPTTLAETITDDTLRYRDSCGTSSGTVICVSQIFLSATDTLQSIRDRSRIQALVTDVTIGGGFSFPDVRAVKQSEVNHRLRLYARGIGMVFEQRDDGIVRRVVYYRVDGNTGGDLTGTPFAAGAFLDGLFFTP